MNYQLSVKLRESIRHRAHLYGAEAMVLDQQARRRYFRELEAFDRMGGHPSPFGELG